MPGKAENSTTKDPTMTVTVIFGSDSGATKAIAARIAAKASARLLDVQEARPERHC
jgi:flavodoxin